MPGVERLLPERRRHVVTKGDGTAVLPECGRPTVPGLVSERACAFYGARWMLGAIPDVIHLVHGPAGCAYFGGIVRRKSYRVFSTQLEESDIVFGAGEKLYRAILEAVAAAPGARAVLVYATCTAGLIGDDLDGICRRAARAVGRPVVPVNSPGFCGYSQAAGHDIAAGVLLEHFIGTGKAQEPVANGVNLLGEFDVMGDLGEIERLLQQLGLRILCAFSGRAATTAMADAHRARLNIVHCRRTGQRLADAMQERFGTPQLKVSFFGFEETASALHSIGKFFGSAGVEEIVEQGRREVGNAAPFLKKLAGKRVALFFGASRIGTMARAFAELGMEVVMIGSQFGCLEDYGDAGARVRAGTVLIDDPPEKELEEFIRKYRPHLFVGGTKEKYLATKLGVPFLVFPQEMSSFAGFRGFVNLAREAAGLVGAPVWRLARCERYYRTLQTAEG
ncbi:nitrogenase component 1 [Syntrophothermus lipocalidus]|uniref:Oxidoreductase/nitrogenase component 1 n=1 Tax=Syntrophothermus lipocalidus (strain DSM 12680 / TGB-C1) TaxID=643648 RepID=D7CIZ0_SYNLT|nr:nitrogenase component 1 [Syntrophothermus lipocalidus]ADI02868.1 oxidoreductase/nitrogenase component 1 [Syntrophothermus lipocalidus DSM 12680]